MNRMLSVLLMCGGISYGSYVDSIIGVPKVGSAITVGKIQFNNGVKGGVDYNWKVGERTVSPLPSSIKMPNHAKWRQYSLSYVAEETGMGVLGLRALSTARAYNDFAIDDVEIIDETSNNKQLAYFDMNTFDSTESDYVRRKDTIAKFGGPGRYVITNLGKWWVGSYRSRHGSGDSFMFIDGATDSQKMFVKKEINFHKGHVYTIKFYITTNKNVKIAINKSNQPAGAIRIPEDANIGDEIKFSANFLNHQNIHETIQKSISVTEGLERVTDNLKPYPPYPLIDTDQKVVIEGEKEAGKVLSAKLSRDFNIEPGSIRYTWNIDGVPLADTIGMLNPSSWKQYSFTFKGSELKNTFGLSLKSRSISTGNDVAIDDFILKDETEDTELYSQNFNVASYEDVAKIYNTLESSYRTTWSQANFPYMSGEIAMADKMLEDDTVIEKLHPEEEDDKFLGVNGIVTDDESYILKFTRAQYDIQDDHTYSLSFYATGNKEAGFQVLTSGDGNGLQLVSRGKTSIYRTSSIDQGHKLSVTATYKTDEGITKCATSEDIQIEDSLFNKDASLTIQQDGDLLSVDEIVIPDEATNVKYQWQVNGLSSLPNTIKAENYSIWTRYNYTFTAENDKYHTIGIRTMNRSANYNDFGIDDIELYDETENKVIFAETFKDRFDASSSTDYELIIGRLTGHDKLKIATEASRELGGNGILGAKYSRHGIDDTYRKDKFLFVDGSVDNQKLFFKKENLNLIPGHTYTFRFYGTVNKNVEFAVSLLDNSGELKNVKRYNAPYFRLSKADIGKNFVLNVQYEDQYGNEYNVVSNPIEIKKIPNDNRAIFHTEELSDGGLLLDAEVIDNRGVGPVLKYEWSKNYNPLMSRPIVTKDYSKWTKYSIRFVAIGLEYQWLELNAANEFWMWNDFAIDDIVLHDDTVDDTVFHTTFDGDFNPKIESDYILQPSGHLNGYGHIAIDTSTKWAVGSRFGRSGSGDKFLFVDAAKDSSKAFYKKYAHLVPGHAYTLSFYATVNKRVKFGFNIDPYDTHTDKLSITEEEKENDRFEVRIYYNDGQGYNGFKTAVYEASK